MEENILAAIHARRAAGNHDALVEAGAGFGNRRGGQVHIDVISDEEIEFAVAIVIDEGTAGVPAFAVGGDAGLCGDIVKVPLPLLW